MYACTYAHTRVHTHTKAYTVQKKLFFELFLMVDFTSLYIQTVYLIVETVTYEKQNNKNKKLRLYTNPKLNSW